ncbi:uncharacterized protein LOC109703914 isoform X1 [Ananas comosus]|uniref:Uncharacterized protein LOC109703914 isoform X1 n=1 Tax=Ananas comosus TaxID=4615 RepID=A0A6P5EAW5_ANACO|nr:uncharacterized protein LOC109703914 isoform X1 [Ananas comosus]
MLIRCCICIPGAIPPRNSFIPSHSSPPPPPPFLSLARLSSRSGTRALVLSAKSQATRRSKTTAEPEAAEAELVPEEDGGGGEVFEGEGSFPFAEGTSGDDEGDGDRGDEGLAYSSGYRGGRDEKDYDRDPELAEILGSCFDDPQKAQARVEERIRRKRGKILHAKTGSATPMEVIFNKFGFSNSYIWFEFYHAPLPKDISLICDTIRSWHIVGRLGGCNSMNMQLSQSPLDSKRPSYDAIQGANVTPTTFYNIGDLEIQDNLARIWVDIGTTEPLLLDVLINALTCISSDYVGIRQVMFGGSEFKNWKDNLTSEDAGFSTHRI